MSRDDVIKEYTKIKGVGKTKAELLYDHGYTSIEKLRKAKVEDLTKIKGITEKNAEDILKHVSKIPSRKKKTEIKKTEKKIEEEGKKQETREEPEEKKEEDVVIIEEEKKTYHAKPKPELPPEKREMLILRRKIKQRTPVFLRQEWFRYKRIPMKWRRPRGISSKMRMHKKYRPSVVRVGFSGPRMVKGLHPSGFEDILVYNVKDLERIDPKTQAARIGGTVGSRKRAMIAKRAEELNIRILNMRV